MDSNGGIESDTCITTIPTTFSHDAALDAPGGVAIHDGFAYFANNANGSGGSYARCAINDNGIESTSCDKVSLADGDYVLTGIAGIAFNDNFVYFTNYGDEGNLYGYTQCATDESGIKPNTCALTLAFNYLSGPAGLCFQ